MKNNFRRWRFALFAGDHGTLNRYMLVAAIITLVVTFYVPAMRVVGLLLLAVLVGLMVFVTRTAFKGYDALVAKVTRESAQAAAYRWARAGADANEVRARHDSIVALGAVGALTAAGIAESAWQPVFNTDGVTPMIPGTMMDFNGNPYGTINDDVFTAADVGTGMTMEPTAEYHSPIGMDDTFGSGHAGGMDIGGSTIDMGAGSDINRI